MSYAHALRSLSVGARHVSLHAQSTASRTIIFHRLPSTSSSSSFTISSSISSTFRGRLQPLQCRRNFWSKLFGRKKKPEAVDPEDAKFIYPTSLCLYTPGRRTVWIGCMKLASCYPFLLTVFYLGPNLQLNWPALYTYPFAQSHPNLTAAILLTLTALPMGMFYLAAPYVTHIFIKIPPYARISQSAVMKWVKTGLNEETRLRIFTMRFLGRPKLVEVPLGELRFCRKRVGCVNLEWVGNVNSTIHGGKVKEKPRVTDFYIERKIGSGKGGHEAFFEVVKWLEENTARIARRQGVAPASSGISSAVGGGGAGEAMFGSTTTSTIASTSTSVKPSVLKEVKKKGGFKKISR